MLTDEVKKKVKVPKHEQGQVLGGLNVKSYTTIQPSDLKMRIEKAMEKEAGWDESEGGTMYFSGYTDAWNKTIDALYDLYTEMVEGELQKFAGWADAYLANPEAPHGVKGILKQYLLDKGSKVKE